MSFGPPSAEMLGRILIPRLAAPRRRRCGAYRFRSEFNYGRDRGPAPHTARHAAVCLLLYPRPDGWSIPFILRSPNSAEVDQLLQIPVTCLRDSRSHGMLQVARPPLDYRAACLQFHGHRICGATARIVGDFLEQAADLFP